MAARRKIFLTGKFPTGDDLRLQAVREQRGELGGVQILNLRDDRSSSDPYDLAVIPVEKVLVGHKVESLHELADGFLPSTSLGRHFMVKDGNIVLSDTPGDLDLRFVDEKITVVKPAKPKKNNRTFRE